MGSNMKKIPFFALFIFTVQYGQSSIGNDLLSDLENSNKNAVYTYWIGTVNGNLRGYEYGVWYALNYLMSNGIISENEKDNLSKKLDLVVPKDLDEEDLFKIVWKFISKNPDYRHMQLSELTHIAIENKYPMDQ